MSHKQCMMIKCYIAASTPFAKYFKEVLLCSSVKLPSPCCTSPLFVHFDGCHVSCNHAAVHDQEAHYRQCKGGINDKCQEQHCRPALQRTRSGAEQILPNKIQVNACPTRILAASVSPRNHCKIDRFHIMHQDELCKSMMMSRNIEQYCSL